MRRRKIYLESDADGDPDSEGGCSLVLSAFCRCNETPERREPLKVAQPKAAVSVSNDRSAGAEGRNMTIRILLADDHSLVREGLRMILESGQDIQVVGEAEGGRTAVDLATDLKPDLVIMDISMKDLNGIEATRQIRMSCPATRVIGLSMHTDDRNVLRMIEAGASGYLLKSSAAEELVRAVHAVANGHDYLSPDIAGVLVEGYVHRLSPSDSPAYAALSLREREVLQLLAEGMTSKEIASRLRISTATVETHRRNVMRKLNIHSIAELTKFAIRQGLTSVDL